MSHSTSMGTSSAMSPGTVCLLVLALVVLQASPAAAFGAGNIGQYSYSSVLDFHAMLTRFQLR